MTLRRVTHAIPGGVVTISYVCNEGSSSLSLLTFLGLPRPTEAPVGKPGWPSAQMKKERRMESFATNAAPYLEQGMAENVWFSAKFIAAQKQPSFLGLLPASRAPYPRGAFQ